MSAETQTAQNTSTNEQNQTQTNTQQSSQTQSHTTHPCEQGSTNKLVDKIIATLERILPLKITLGLIDSLTLPSNPLEYMLAEIFQLIPVLIIVVTMINAFEKLVSIG